MRITNVRIEDVRFPTSRQKHGSDAVHIDPDYSVALVILNTDRPEFSGHGVSFTIGRGTEVVCRCIEAFRPLVVGRLLSDICDNFAAFWRALVNDSQLRWLGPAKGVSHLAAAAVLNAVWDLWARSENKPLWKLLTDLPAERLVSLIDFTHISDELDERTALQMLSTDAETLLQREKLVLESGYPAYTTAVGWLGYSTDKIQQSCREHLAAGWQAFKVKVGDDLDIDKSRLQAVRDVIGWQCELMVDANQRWEIDEAIRWTEALSPFKPVWIEEPTSPDDILGNARIAKNLAQHNIGVASGEMCHNKVMFKQFLQAGAMQYCQVDACRLASVNEILAVYLMAARRGVPVCPHAGGVCLNEMVQHLQVFDFVRVSGCMEGRRIEYVDHLSQYLEDPANCVKGRYMPPLSPGYGSRLKPSAIERFRFPEGSEWRQTRSQQQDQQ